MHLIFCQPQASPASQLDSGCTAHCFRMLKLLLLLALSLLASLLHATSHESLSLSLTFTGHRLWGNLENPRDSCSNTRRGKPGQ